MEVLFALIVPLRGAHTLQEACRKRELIHPSFLCSPHLKTELVIPIATSDVGTLFDEGAAEFAAVPVRTLELVSEDAVDTDSRNIEYIEPATNTIYSMRTRPDRSKVGETETFDDAKSRALASLRNPAPDKSRAGGIDDAAKPFCAAINAHPDLFTTSSCSGRVIVFRQATQYNKCTWILVEHDIAAIAAPLRDRIAAAVASLSPPESGDSPYVYFKVEPPVYTIRCRTLSTAKAALIALRRAGFKQTALISLKNCVIRVSTNHRLELPIYFESAEILGKEGWEHIVKEAEEKIKAAREMFDRVIGAENEINLGGL